MHHPHVLDTVGRTPLVAVDLQRAPGIDFRGKLEFANPMGSLKDRAASYVLRRLLDARDIGPGAWVVESSSGNFGVALAAYCRYFGLRFHCVVDPRISPPNEALIRSLATSVTKVTQRDETGGYLLTRIEAVQSFLEREPAAYWTNQYANPLVADAYFHTLGAELCELDRLDYLFVPVSSGGTISGLSRRVKEKFPSCRVVAVDCEGSIVFGGPPRARFIPGIGSSMVPKILATARIDDVQVIDESSALDACHRMLREHAIYAGGSSGFVVAAVERMFSGNSTPATQASTTDRPVVVGLFADRGDRYAATVYNERWCTKLREGRLSQEELDSLRPPPLSTG